jgi:hypothetical protein
VFPLRISSRVLEEQWAIEKWWQRYLLESWLKTDLWSCLITVPITIIIIDVIAANTELRTRTIEDIFRIGRYLLVTSVIQHSIFSFLHTMKKTSAAFSARVYHLLIVSSMQYACMYDGYSWYAGMYIYQRSDHTAEMLDVWSCPEHGLQGTGDPRVGAPTCQPPNGSTIDCVHLPLTRRWALIKGITQADGSSVGTVAESMCGGISMMWSGGGHSTQPWSVYRPVCIARCYPSDSKLPSTHVWPDSGPAVANDLVTSWPGCLSDDRYQRNAVWTGVTLAKLSAMWAKWKEMWSHQKLPCRTTNWESVFQIKQRFLGACWAANY